MRAIAVIACAFLSAPPRVADFRNVAEKAGLTHSFPNGGVTSKQFIIETTGSGVALLDYDNDGLLDIFVVSGKGGSNRLYHNEGPRKRVCCPMAGVKASAPATTITMATSICSSRIGARTGCIAISAASGLRM